MVNPHIFSIKFKFFDFYHKPIVITPIFGQKTSPSGSAIWFKLTLWVEAFVIFIKAGARADKDQSLGSLSNTSVALNSSPRLFSKSIAASFCVVCSSIVRGPVLKSKNEIVIKQLGLGKIKQREAREFLPSESIFHISSSLSCLDKGDVRNSG